MSWYRWFGKFIMKVLFRCSRNLWPGKLSLGCAMSITKSKSKRDSSDFFLFLITSFFSIYKPENLYWGFQKCLLKLSLASIDYTLLLKPIYPTVGVWAIGFGLNMLYCINLVCDCQAYWKFCKWDDLETKLEVSRVDVLLIRIYFSWLKNLLYWAIGEELDASIILEPNCYWFFSMTGGLLPGFGREQQPKN